MYLKVRIHANGFYPMDDLKEIVNGNRTDVWCINIRKRELNCMFISFYHFSIEISSTLNFAEIQSVAYGI